MKENPGNGSVVALCYDFDRTLSPSDMQSYGYIQQTGLEIGEFWDAVASLARRGRMDPNLAYMYLMLREARGRFAVTRGALKELGSRIELFPGLGTWFERVNGYGAALGLTVEHSIISSGIAELIEGTAIRGHFKNVFANSFLYDETGQAVWPAANLNYTNKTQFLFRISKNELDITDSAGVNAFRAPGEFPIPFENIIYLGDSLTDIPCMKLVKSLGGQSIGVYNPAGADLGAVRELFRQGRVNYFAPADYREGGELEGLIREILALCAARAALGRRRARCLEA